MKSQIRDRTMYKHSFGHYYTSFEANAAMVELLDKCPDLRLEIVREKRSNTRWAKYCVCEYVPFKKDKDKVQKSNLRRKNRNREEDRKGMDLDESE